MSERSERGFTLVETLIVTVMLAIMAAVAIPNFLVYKQRSQVDAATRQMVEAVREARSKAILRGWEYRIYGFNSGSSSTYKNKYRLMGRSSNAVAWAADSSGSFENATAMASEWINIGTVYPGVTFNPTDGTDHFWVVFNNQGVAYDIDDSFNPLRVTHTTGGTKSVYITSAGSVKIQ